MKAKSIIRIPNPCSEDWDAMTPGDKGRHCSLCDKLVIDFTLYSDQQLLDFVQQSSGKGFCGRFIADQLGRELIPAKRRFLPRPAIQRVAATFMAAQAFVTDTIAQAKKLPANTHSVSHNSALRKYTIKGKVLDYGTNRPVAGCRIPVDSGTFVITDHQGRFIIHLPATFVGDTFIIRVFPIATNPVQGLESSTVLDKEVNIHGSSEHILYQYRRQQLQEAEVRSERPKHPLINVSSACTVVTGGGQLERLVIQPANRVHRSTFWQRLARRFQRKRK